jgi:hypothetical protein
MLANNLRAFGIFLIGLMVPAGLCAAQESAEATESPPGLVDRSHEKISGHVEAFLRKADALFAGPDSSDASTGSYVQLGGAMTFVRPKDGDHDFRALIRAKIRLPRTNDKLQLIVDRGLDTLTRSQSETEADRALRRREVDEDLFVGLRAVISETLKVSLTADTGLRLKGTSLDPYVRGRAQRIFEAGQWRIPLSETLLWRRVDGASAATDLAFAREVSASTILILASNATFRDSSDYFDLSEVFTLSRRLNDRSLVALEAGAFARTKPSVEATTYTLALRYRRRVHRDWVVMEIRPQISYPREQHYDPVPSLTVQMEAYFGKGKFPEP